MNQLLKGWIVYRKIGFYPLKRRRCPAESKTYHSFFFFKLSKQGYVVVCLFIFWARCLGLTCRELGLCASLLVLSSKMLGFNNDLNRNAHCDNSQWCYFIELKKECGWKLKSYYCLGKKRDIQRKATQCIFANM